MSKKQNLKNYNNNNNKIYRITGGQRPGGGL